MDIQLNDIALFVEVVQRKSFSQAADALNIPAATLSRRVTELERGLGTPLLIRSTRKLSLTEAGALYFERCRHAIEQARTAHEQLLDISSQAKSRLRISMPVSLAQLFLPAILRDFHAKHPEIECDLDLSAQPVDPISNPFDLVLRFGEQPDSNLISRKIVLMEHHLYAAPSYLERYGEPLTPADLTHHECLRPATTQDASLWVLRSGKNTERVNVSGRFAANNIGLLGRMAAQGLGITPLLVFEAMGKAIRQGGLKRVLADWSLAPLPFFALLPSRIVPAKTKAFLDFIQPRLGDAE